jgi:hypothetical protein
VSRILALSLSVVALTVAGLATAAQAGAEDEGTTYQRYADIRERLYSCHMETVQGTQTSEHRADCRRLARDFVLYGYTGEGFVLHVHCRSASRCIPTPSSEPPADGPIPAGSTIYDIRVAQASSHHRKRKHRRHHKRSRRSRAAHGSAAAAR